MKKKLIITGSIILALVIICLIVGNYFFHTTVDIDSDFEVGDIRIIDEDGNEKSAYLKHFSHPAKYGKYKYQMVVNDHKFIIDVMKTNDMAHYDVDIDIKGIDGMGVEPFKITVSVNGVPRESETYDFNDIEAVYINVGP